MAAAVRIHDYGGPEVHRSKEVEIGRPGPGQLRITQTVAGANFLDIYRRRGEMA